MKECVYTEDICVSEGPEQLYPEWPVSRGMDNSVTQQTRRSKDTDARKDTGPLTGVPLSEGRRTPDRGVWLHLHTENRNQAGLPLSRVGRRVRTVCKEAPRNFSG